jgi:hypothetical protein
MGDSSVRQIFCLQNGVTCTKQFLLHRGLSNSSESKRGFSIALIVRFAGIAVFECTRHSSSNPWPCCPRQSEQLICPE